MMSKAALKREMSPVTYLPYTRHVDNQVIALSGGGLMVILALDGMAFDTADVGDINTLANQLNVRWRNVAGSAAGDGLSLWHHIVRRRHHGLPEGEFRSSFSRELNRRYLERVGGTDLYVNELFLTVVWMPGGQGGVEGFSALARRVNKARRGDTEVEAAGLRALHDVARDLEVGLARYGARQLGLYEREGLIFSEPMEVLNLVLNGEPSRMPLVNGLIGSAIYTNRIIFGREALEIRGAGSERFAAILSVKEYPSRTRPGMFDGLLSAKFEFVLTQSFRFLRRANAIALMGRQQNKMSSGRDKAASQASALTDAMDALASGEFAMGEHNLSLLVYADGIAALQARVSDARRFLSDSGVVVAREDLALEAAFWAQFPGNIALRPRVAAITTRNLAGFMPFHTYPAGKPNGNHWGPALTMLKTAAGGPYHFSFHVEDLGNTFICGPSGSGKTVVQNFLLSQLEKFGAQLVFIDKDRGADIFVRAAGGVYLPLTNGKPTGFAPLRALELTPGNVSFLSTLIRKLVTREGSPMTVRDERAIEEGIRAMEVLPMAKRSFSALRQFLGQSDSEGVGARLEKWCSGGALGWVFDNPSDDIRLDAKFLGFDMTDFLDNPEIRTPVMLYLFHRIESLIDGRRIVIDIDEFWKALADEAFSDLAKNKLKTIRKQGGLLIAGTQSAADALESDISATIVEQCPTKIFLPNPRAARADYIDGMKLSEREFRAIREEMLPEQRRFLVKKGHDSVVVELNLDGFDADLAVLSGTTRNVAICEQARATMGERPSDWLPEFHRLRVIQRVHG